MFERLRRWLGGGVKLGTDDREVIYTTTNSDDLARSILQTAQETAKDLISESIRYFESVG